MGNQVQAKPIWQKRWQVKAVLIYSVKGPQILSRYIGESRKRGKGTLQNGKTGIALYLVS